MCGICGRFNLDGRPVEREQIEAMRDLMVHRGPDSAGLLVEGPVGLGHRRLAIIDLEGGQQPISNEDGTVTVIFNGEIYNYVELRNELTSRGHLFRTRSDTEVIVHLYEELGAQCVQRLRGMFAFALWDARRRQLLLARDRLGIKPLYYAHTARALLFGSEIKSVLGTDEVPAEVDPQGLRRYLVYRHPYGNGTLFKGVRELPPGHTLSADARGVRVQRYWDVPAQGDGAAGAQRFLPLLEEAVKLRMISDVPLGSYLSGGIDSSVITALMARHTDRVRTFAVGFVPGADSELPWARIMARHCGAEHREFVLGAQDFHTLLPRLVWYHDEPLTFPASVPLYLLSRESKRVATVMLAGEGADEILAGYRNNVRSYWWARMATHIPHPMQRLLAQLPLPGRAYALAARTAPDESSLIAATFKLPGHREMAAASRVPLPDDASDDYELQEEVGIAARRGTFLDRLLYFQLKTYLVALLVKQDKMSMAASIESRVPYLDHHLVEYAFALPDYWKVRGASGKYLLRQAARGLVPEAIINRPKRGFPLPLVQWLREPGNPLTGILLEGTTLREGLLDARYVRSRLARFQAGENNTLELWGMLNLELWRRNFLASTRVGGEAMAA